ncbi:MAG: putative baseplate assembly protein [Anaerolineaceae bacterium]|nr:putative baseplate assembly protein [Anaerolineaceae bacterium]MCB9100309.1 putative baseplate assembly protein [Anaerolineales bacterium]
MALPEPILDDLRFQADLVDEARRRIVQYCPEWTDYNLSDPGITLIELFAWMTEMIVYRLNRVPDKNYIKFLDLLGVQLRPATSARSELTFWLSTPFPITPEDDTVVVIPQGTEVATRRTEEEDEVIFTTDARAVIAPPHLRLLYHQQEVHKNYQPDLGISTFIPFQDDPQQGDTFYLGFDPAHDISGYILQLTFQCEKTEGVGINSDDPPLVWRYSKPTRWGEVAVSTRSGEEDTTKGLNEATGRLVLYLPLDMSPVEMNGRDGYWLSCSFEARRPDQQGQYTKSPRIRHITVHVLGITTEGTQAIVVNNEILGRSNGEPGQMLQLEHAPILTLEAGETVEVEEKMGSDSIFVPWARVDDFSRSTKFDAHYTLETNTGQIHFGPGIRHRTGEVVQYGRIPPANRTIRFNRYRYGGGVVGNVPANKLQILKSTIPYIDRVTNLTQATGGRDPEGLDEVKIRAKRELRAQRRAVTAEDYEDLAKTTTHRIARVKCNVPQAGGSRLTPGMVEILIVPDVVDALKVGELSQLQVSKTLAEGVKNYLDDYRLLTTILRVREPNYIGVKVHAEVVPAQFSRPETIKLRVIERLRQFINCLSLSENREQFDELMTPNWEGWPFGRNLYVAEIYSLIQRVPGVKHVLDVQLWQRPVVPAEEPLPDTEQAVQRNEEQLVPVEKKALHVSPDALLCSLNHQVTIVELDDDV